MLLPFFTCFKRLHLKENKFARSLSFPSQHFVSYLLIFASEHTKRSYIPVTVKLTPPTNGR